MMIMMTEGGIALGAAAPEDHIAGVAHQEEKEGLTAVPEVDLLPIPERPTMDPEVDPTQGVQKEREQNHQQNNFNFDLISARS